MLNEISQTQSNTSFFFLMCRYTNNNDLKLENGLLGTEKEMGVGWEDKWDGGEGMDSHEQCILFACPEISQ